MQFRERQVNSVTVIDVQGDFVATANPYALQSVVKTALERGDRQIVLNIAGIKRMDSTCLGDVVASYTSTIGRGGMLKVAGPNRFVRRLLEMTKLDTVIQVFATDAEAIADFVRHHDAIC